MQRATSVYSEAGASCVDDEAEGVPAKKEQQDKQQQVAGMESPRELSWCICSGNPSENPKQHQYPE
jgi:hypothetical protein